MFANNTVVSNRTITPKTDDDLMRSVRTQQEAALHSVDHALCKYAGLFKMRMKEFLTNHENFEEWGQEKPVLNTLSKRLLKDTVDTILSLHLNWDNISLRTFMPGKGYVLLHSEKEVFAKSQTSKLNAVESCICA